MISLQFPTYTFTTQEMPNGKVQIWDMVRRKYVALTPEEWVRQHVLHYLITTKNEPKGLVSVEMPLVLHQQAKRADVVLCDRQAMPLLMVECKAPSVVLSQAVLEQITRYNMVLQVPFWWIINGLQHFIYHINYVDNNYAFLADIPTFGEMLQLDGRS
ncbi:MAG TPA: type I restriction enzyme HsdR N-terminal domain-containing protein [Chitinophagales bacterium]|nr:type I restriction enzyme HsdR N-terminal domain-containing protein [Chitinophagales bacterium]